MVAAAQCPQLGPAALAGLYAHLGGIGSRHVPALLAVGQICLNAVALLHCPFRAVDESLGQLLVAGMQPARGPQAGGDGLEEGIDEGIDERLHALRLQIRAQQAHAAVDVKAHPAGADDAILLAKGSHAADGKAIAQMGIGHGHGVLDNAGQGGNVGHLIDRSRLHHLPQRRGDKNSPRHAHARSVADGHLVSIIVDLANLCHNHTSKIT